MKKVIISPSILNADRSKLDNTLTTLENLGAEYLHFDVMDGKFVPPTSFDLEDLKVVSKKHTMVNDVHIMIEEPIKYAKDYVVNGADILTFHYEACDSENQISEVINIIHENGGKAGLSIKPNTPVEVVLPFLKDLELILVMSVEPGYGGQAFIPSALGKIEFLRKYIDENKLNCLIEVDGGINGETSKLCRDAGVDILVVGSYLVDKPDIEQRMESLRK